MPNKSKAKGQAIKDWVNPDLYANHHWVVYWNRAHNEWCVTVPFKTMGEAEVKMIELANHVGVRKAKGIYVVHADKYWVPEQKT